MHSALIRLMAPALRVVRWGPPPPRRWGLQTRPDNCAHTVVSMLTGLTISEVGRIAGSESALGVSQVRRLIMERGFACGRPIAGRHAADFWPVYRHRAGGPQLRGLGFYVARPGEEYGHVYLLFGRYVYDVADGSFERLDASRVRAFDWVILFERPSAQ